MKTFAPFAMLVIVACAVCTLISSRPAAASVCGNLGSEEYIAGLASSTSSGDIVLTWRICPFGYKMIEHVTRTPAFPASSYPAGYAEVIPPRGQPGVVGNYPQTFKDVDAKQGVSYTYTVCAYWVMAVHGNGSNEPPTSLVNATSCSKPVSARLTYTVQRFGTTKVNQPTNVSAVRSNASTVGLSWSAPGGDDTAHFYLLSFTTASTPPTNWKAPGWNNIAAVAATVRTHNLNVSAAPSGQHNYFMVCAGNANDSAVNCSTAVTEKGLPFAPALVH